MSGEFTVVIAAAGRPELLQRTLASLANCSKPTGYCGVVLVENGPKRELEQVATAFVGALGLRYVHVLVASKSNALNVALGMIERGLVCFFDDDVRLDEGTLRAYADAAADGAARQFFGGPAFIDYEQRPPEWLIPYLPASAKGWEWKGEGLQVQTAAFIGFNWAAYAEDVRRVNLFDTSVGPGSVSLTTVGDETLVQQRLLASGVQGRYVPDARVWHYVPVNRCSPEWAIERKRRHGFAHGMLRQHRRAQVFGYPIWMLRRWLRTRAALTLSRGAPSKHFRFKAEYWHAFSNGLLAGVATGRRPAGEPGTATETSVSSAEVCRGINA